VETSVLKVVGQVAGIGGIALGVLLLVFREVIRKNIFGTLTRDQSYQLIRLIIILTFAIAVVGIVAWVYSLRGSAAETVANTQGTPPKKRLVTTVQNMVREKKDETIYSKTFAYSDRSLKEAAGDIVKTLTEVLVLSDPNSTAHVSFPKNLKSSTAKALIDCKPPDRPFKLFYWIETPKTTFKDIARSMAISRRGCVRRRVSTCSSMSSGLAMTWSLSKCF
jgi:hypothetical protein